MMLATDDDGNDYHLSSPAVEDDNAVHHLSFILAPSSIDSEYHPTPSIVDDR